MKNGDEVLLPKVLFVDLLYSEGGSLDEDMKSITKAASVGHQVEYLRFDEKSGYGVLIAIFHHVLTRRYEKIVFLSSKVSQLLLLIPLRLLSKCYAIYHYMPRHRQSFHKFALSIIHRYFVIGVYAPGVAENIEKSVGFRPPVIPSRIVDRKNSLSKLHKKLSQKQIHLLVPGVRSGVRICVKLAPILQKLKDLGMNAEEIIIQGDASPEGEFSSLVRKVGKLTQDQYDDLYNSSLIVALEFDQDYEVRASGVILDAIRSGCLVLSSNHQIIRQYGFPSTIVTDLEHLESTLNNIKNCTDEQALTLIPGLDLEEFESKWRLFLS